MNMALHANEVGIKLYCNIFCNRCANNLISLKSNRLKSNAAQQVNTPEVKPEVKSVESSGKPTPTNSVEPTQKSKSPKSSKKSGSRSNSRSSSANREIRIEVKPQGM